MPLEHSSSRTLAELRAKSLRLPFVEGRKVELALWVKRQEQVAGEAGVFTPGDVLGALGRE